MKNQLRGCVKINVRGKRLNHFINALHARRIAIFNQYIKGGTLSAEIYRSELSTIRNIAENYDLELTSFEYDTISKEVISRRRRSGLILGVILILGASLYFSSVIVTIDIQGNETVSDTVILSALSEIGIEEGSQFGQINYVWSENQLRLMVDKLAWVGMHRTGHRLVVEVTELAEKPDMLNERLPCNVLAAHDAEIVDISVLDGQLMHMVGDYVFAGDMLINGVTSDQTNHIVLHHAMGEIIGIYKESAEFHGEFTQKRLTSTGKTDKRRSLRLFSLEIPLYFGKNRYEYAETSFAERPLSLFGKKLPISLKTATYSELKRTEEEIDEESLKAELMEKVFLYEKNFLSDCEILERNITESKNADTLTLSVTYKLKGDICVQKDILVK